MGHTIGLRKVKCSLAVQDYISGKQHDLNHRPVFFAVLYMQLYIVGMHTISVPESNVLKILPKFTENSKCSHYASRLRTFITEHFY